MKRKKFSRLVFLFILAVILIAWFTKPGLEKFKTYLQEAPAVSSPPSIEATDAFLYSKYKVTYFQPAIIPDSTGRSEKKVVVPGTTETYIGVFGRFWKMND